MTSLSSKIAKNLSGYGYSQIITLASQILVVPFFLSAWGVREYGEWLVLTSIPLFLAMLELGVAEASATKATLASGSKDINAVKKTIDTAMAFSIATAITVAIIGNALAFSVPWDRYLKLIDINADNASIIFSCMSFYLACNFLAGPISAWLKAMDRTALSAFSTANRRAAEMIATAIALIVGAGPTALAATLLATCFTTVVLYYIVALRHSSIGAMTIRNASTKELHTVIWPALSYMALPLAQVITLQGGVLILNSLAGAAAVTVFTMARTMVRLLMQVGVVFNNAMRPEVSRLLGQGNIKAAYKTVRKWSIISYILIIFGIIGIGLFGPYTLKIWSAGKVILQPQYLILLSTHAVVNVLWYVPSTIFFSQNRHGNFSWYYMAFSTVSLLLWWSFSSLTTPSTGAALMMLIPELLMLALIILLSLFDSDKNKDI